MKTKLFTLLLALWASIGTMFAYVEIDGINYVLNKTYLTAEVYKTEYSNYSGNIVIPESIVYESETYSVISIGNSAFEWCTGLTSITLPNSIYKIDNFAFRGCSGLSSITLPNSIQWVGIQAFSSCTGLKTVSIGEEVVGFQEYVFLGCINLPVIDNIRYADTYLVGAVDKTLSSYTVKDGTKFIGHEAFKSCTNLTSITFPNSVTNIECNAFEDCTAFTSITIPNSITSIGSKAFKGCSNVTSIMWKAERCLSSDAFSSISSQITSFSFGDEVKTIPTSLCSAMINLTSIKIPNSVISIGENAFQNCQKLSNVIIGNGVTNIGKKAFYNCYKLKDLEIGSSLDSVGNYAFYSCYDIEELNLPNSIKSIGDYSFHGCLSLSDINLPNSLSTIGAHAFEYCRGLKSIVVGEGMTNIGEDAFYNCDDMQTLTWNAINSADLKYFFSNDVEHTPFPSNITSVTFGDKVQRIPGGVCGGMKNITSITIPSSVKSIGKGAFANCARITSVVIPESVTSIENNAFNPCVAVDTFYVKSDTPASLGMKVFAENAKIKVNCSAQEAYRNNSQWNIYNISDECMSGKSDQPTASDLTKAGYDVVNNVVLCFKFVDDASLCNDVVIAGTYNNWNTNLDNMLKMRPLAGFDGWYAAEFLYTVTTNSNNEPVYPQAKPVQLKSDGSFSWEFQSGDVNAWIHIGEHAAYVVSGLDYEANIYYPEAGVYIYEISYWKKHSTPCIIIPKHNYTIHLYAPNACSEMEPAIIGAFNNWAENIAMTKQKDAQDKTYYAYTVYTEEKTEFKFREVNDNTWENQLQAYNVTSEKWYDMSNFVLPVATKDTTIVYDFSDNSLYRFSLCSGEAPTDIENIYDKVLPKKVLINGMFYILREDHTYTTDGRLVR